METTIQREKLLVQEQCDKLVYKNIIIFLLGKLVSLFGSSMYSFAVGLYVLSETGSGTSFALTIVLATIPRAILGPVSGVLADRLDKKKMVVLLDILSGVIVLGLVAFSYINGLKLIYIYITTVLLNITNVFFDTTISTSVPQLVDKERLTKINSFGNGISSLAFIVGPAIGGLVFALMDIKVFLIINGLSFVFSGISETFLDFDLKDKIYGKEEAVDSLAEIVKPSFMDDLIEGFRYIVKSKWILALALASTLANMSVTMGLNIPVPYIAKEFWGFSNFQYGIAMAAFPLGMIIASIVVGIVPQGEKNHKKIVAGMGIFAINLICMGILTKFLPMDVDNWIKLGILSLMFIIMAAGAAVLNIPLMVTLQTQIPSEMLGRTMGVLMTIASVMTPVGALLGGILIDHIAPWILPFTCGLAMVGITFAIIINKDLRKV